LLCLKLRVSKNELLILSYQSFKNARPKNWNCKECVVLWESDELASGVFISKGLVEYRRAYAWRDEVTVRKAM
jgi:hypothetical protein